MLSKRKVLVSVELIAEICPLVADQWRLAMDELRGVLNEHPHHSSDRYKGYLDRMEKAMIREGKWNTLRQEVVKLMEGLNGQSGLE
jgi:hypothetical protein